MAHCYAALPIGVGLLVSSAFAADEKPAHPPVPKVQAPRAGAGRSANPKIAAASKAPDTNARPNEQLLDKLLKMSPEEREKALRNLPEPRRQNIERGLSQYQKLPPAVQHFARTRLEMLHSLPEQRQNQVHRSLKQLQELPPERRQQINQELLRMAALPDDERRAYMNTEEFRNRYSASEQQIMDNVSRITPEIPPKN